MHGKAKEWLRLAETQEELLLNVSNDKAQQYVVPKKYRTYMDLRTVNKRLGRTGMDIEMLKQ
jgi:hypothetical protein